MDQCQTGSTNIGFMARFGRNVLGNTSNILHQSHRLLKHVMIDPLEDVANWGAALVEFGRIGIIDMTAAIRNRSDELAIKVESTEYRTQSTWRMRTFHLAGLLG